MTRWIDTDLVARLDGSLRAAGIGQADVIQNTFLVHFTPPDCDVESAGFGVAHKFSRRVQDRPNITSARRVDLGA